MTAVQWLEKICNDRGYHLMSEYFKQAKQMEKNQIMDAYITGIMHPLEIEVTKQSEQYYNETYGNNTSNTHK